jgi:hypothetical protein
MRFDVRIVCGLAIARVVCGLSATERESSGFGKRHCPVNGNLRSSERIFRCY